MGMDIVQILGYGLTGLGFLLMFLAYRLVDKVISTRSAQPLVISTINRYMLVCLIMSALVGVFTFINTRYKQDELEAKTEVIRSKELALNIMTAAQQNDLLSDRILAKTDSLGIVNDPGKREQLKEEIEQAKAQQAQVLDTLGKYVAEKGDPKLSQQFANLRKSIKSVNDSIRIKGTTPDKKRLDTLSTKYQKANNSIRQITLVLADSVAGKRSSPVTRFRRAGD